MRSISRLFHTLIRDRKGATAVEYGLILSLIFLAMLAGAQVMSTGTVGLWSNVSTKMKSTSG